MNGMGTPISPARDFEILASVAKALLAIQLLGGIGCSRTMYTADSLPTDFVAPPIVPKYDIDLSRLAGPPARNDVVHSGDQIEVSIATGIEKGELPIWPLRVSRYGVVDVPIVGPVVVAGMTFTDAEQAIRSTSIQRGKFVSPNVSLALTKRHANLVTVLGAVNKPGSYEIPVANSDILSALMAAEGISEDAGTILEIWHPPQATSVPNRNQPPAAVAELTSHGPSDGDFTGGRLVRIDITQAALQGSEGNRVEDGSVVKALPRPIRMIKVIGLVQKPDEYDMAFDEEVRLLDALAKAGGRTMQIADKVRIIRQVPGSNQLVTIGASVREAKRSGNANIRLAPGDVLSIEETPLTFTVETIRNFVRFGFSTAVPGL